MGRDAASAHAASPVALLPAWCTGATEVLLRGDFDGDGHSDRLCWSAPDGHWRLDLMNPFLLTEPFGGTDRGGYLSACSEPGEELRVEPKSQGVADAVTCLNVRTGSSRRLQLEAGVRGGTRS
jgi:hypothetical protein